MNRFRNIIMKEIDALKYKKFEAMHRAALPYDKQIEKLTKLLSLYDDESVEISRDIETKSLPSADEAMLPLWEDSSNLSPREKVKKIGLNTQEMAVKVLSDNKREMLALDILKEINSRWNLGLARSSLSPQLSRLKAKGILIDNNGYWQLVSDKEKESKV